MSNLLEKLEKKFNALIDSKDLDEFFTGLIKYFGFIEENVPLNNIADSIFSSPSSPSTLNNIKKLYQKIIFGKSQNYSFSITPISMPSPGLFLFHGLMIEKAEQAGLRRKKEIILYTKAGDQRICLDEDNPPCYPFKGKETQRFKIVYILYRTKTGHTARVIANLLHQDGSKRGVQANIKGEIDRINKKFRKDLQLEDDKDCLIAKKGVGINTYYLNRERFDFRVEK